MIYKPMYVSNIGQLKMSLVANTVCKNIKFHVKVKNKEQYINFLKSDSSFITKRTASFVVIRLPCTHCFYCCYYSGHVNVTGVPCLADIEKQLDRFCILLNLNRNDISQVIVDNITAVIHPISSTRVNLFQLINFIRSNNYDEVKGLKYNNQIFPGLFIKTLSGTIIWFNSNAISCVGSKCMQDVEELRNLIVRITSEYISRNVSTE